MVNFFNGLRTAIAIFSRNWEYFKGGELRSILANAFGRRAKVVKWINLECRCFVYFVHFCRCERMARTINDDVLFNVCVDV